MVERMWEKVTLIYLLLIGMSISTITMENCVFLKYLKIEMPYDTAIPLLWIYPKEYESGYNKVTYMPMFIAALFAIAKLWK
jgi:hypothetical protein